MTEDLHDLFRRAAADPPPPSQVPSTAVFTRVRTVRRRRTAGAAVFAAATVAAVAVLAGSLTDIDSSPPVTNQPSVSVTPTPSPPALAAAVTLRPIVTGRTLTMRITVAGTVLVPRAEGADLPKDTSFVDLALGTEYLFGDGEGNGSDGGDVTCTGAKTRRTGKQTYDLPDVHTYTKPGTYTFTYKLHYCKGRNSQLTATKTTVVRIR